MSEIVTLNQKASCLSLSEKIQKQIKAIKDSFFNIAKQLGKGFVAVIKNTVTGALEGATDDFKRVKEEALASFEYAQTLRGTALQKWSELKKNINQLTTPTECENSSITDTTIKTNVIKDIMSSPSTNDDTIQKISPEYKHKKLIEDSKSKTIEEQKTVAESIISSLSDSSVLTTREMVRHLKGIQPDIDNAIKSHPLGLDASEYIGSSVLSYTLDKPSLQLINWKNGTPNAIRKNLQYKINTDVYDEVKKLYDTTNKGLHENLPREFKDEQNGLGLYLSHAYHIAGDYSFYKNHINTNTIVGKLIEGATIANIDDSIVLINYITPIVEDITINNTPTVLFEENYEIPVDNRKNIVRNKLTMSEELQKV